MTGDQNQIAQAENVNLLQESDNDHNWWSSYGQDDDDDQVNHEHGEDDCEDAV